MREKKTYRGQNSKGHSGWMMGTSSLLMIFTVLCLTIFALLSLNTAVAGARLSQRSAEAVISYYTAEKKAHEILTALRRGTVPEGVMVVGNLYHYTCSISDRTALAVTVRVEADGKYEILKWQSVASVPWIADTHIEVWGG